MRHGVVGVGETVVSGVFPLDEVLVGESVGRRHVVGERRAWARRDVNVHAEETAASVDVNVAGAIDGAVALLVMAGWYLVSIFVPYFQLRLDAEPWVCAYVISDLFSLFLSRLIDFHGAFLRPHRRN